MALPFEIDGVALALKGLLVVSLAISGMYLLIQANRARQPAIVKNGRIVAKGLHRIAPVAVVLPPQRLKPGVELSRLADVVTSAHARLDTITTCQRSASRHLDAAESALNALLADIVGVMPPTIAPTVQPRRTMALAA